MGRHLAAVVAVFSIGLLSATPGSTCTTVCLLEKDRAVVAYNYDYYPSEGLVLANKRGTRKKSWVDPQHASWTARHGSVTFNQFGRDNPTTGVNEKGLMVSLMWLNGSEYPPADDRPALGILEWVQFHLDTNATVAEVVATAKSFRPTSKIPIHYIFADASGDAAVIEFLEGKLIVYRGDTMPVKALANSTYADSVAAFKAFKESGTTSAEEAKTRTPPPGFGSLDRFVRGAMLSPAKGDPVAHGFEILSQVKQANTRWSIVYDLNVGEVFFKTDVNPEIRHFTVAGFNYSCGTPVQMLDLTAPGSGQVQTHFADYTTAAVRTLLKNSLKGRPDTFIEKIATNPDLTSACTDGS